MKMEEILTHYPSAKRALFQKYHIGGCSSCGYSMEESLESVMINHRREKEIHNAIQFIYESEEVDRKLKMSPSTYKSEIEKGEEIHLIDIREEWETSIASIPNSQVLTRQLAYEILQKWDKNSKIVFYCHRGHQSLEAASYFKGHGLPNVFCLEGGIDRYSEEIDSSIPKYE